MKQTFIVHLACAYSFEQNRNDSWLNEMWEPVKMTSVQFRHSVISDSLWPHGLQHTRPPCPSPSPGVYSNSCPLSVMPSSHLILCRPLLLLPPIPPSIRVFSNESTLRIGGQSIGVSASTSVLPMNTQDWSLLGWTDWVSLQSKGLSRVFSNTTVQKHQWHCYTRQFFSVNLLEIFLNNRIRQIDSRFFFLPIVSVTRNLFVCLYLLWCISCRETEVKWNEISVPWTHLIIQHFFESFYTSRHLWISIKFVPHLPRFL